MLRCFLIAIVAILITSDEVVGQTQSGRRGRFFQKLKQEVFGTPKPAADQKRTTPKKPQTRTPTPLDYENSKKRSSLQQPTLNSDSRNKNRIQQYSANGTSSDHRSAGNRNPSYNQQANKTGLPNRSGFGFGVAANAKDQLYVAKLERYGNGAEAGLRRGDLIEEIGGIEASSTEEFDEIVKVMSPGDQMEFKITRNGRDQKINVPFGNLPKEDDIDSETKQTSIAAKRYDFAPPDQTARSNSVLNRPAAVPNQMARAVSTRFSNQNEGQHIRLLNQTIAEQSSQIQKLQREIMQLRRTNRSR